MDETTLINALQHFEGYRGSYALKDKLPTNLSFDDFFLLNTDKSKKQIGEHWLIIRKLQNNSYEQIDSDYSFLTTNEIQHNLQINEWQINTPSFKWQSTNSLACGEFCLTILFLIRFHQYHSFQFTPMNRIESLYFRENKTLRNEILCKHIVYHYILINNKPPSQKEITEWLKKM